MNKKELAESVAKKVDIKKGDALLLVNTVIEAIKDGVMKDGKVQLLGFGTFKTVDMAERTGRNPHTGEQMVIPAKRKPKFVVGKTFRDEVNNA